MENSDNLGLRITEKFEDVGAMIQSFLVKKDCVVEERCSADEAKFLSFSSGAEHFIKVTEVETELVQSIPLGESFEIPANSEYRLALPVGMTVFVFTADLHHSVHTS